MKAYLACTCGSDKTYISVSKETCCEGCFKPLIEKENPVEDGRADIFPDSGGWAVWVNGEQVKYFSKYEDCAFTEAMTLVNRINQGLGT